MGNRLSDLLTIPWPNFPFPFLHPFTATTTLGFPNHENEENST